jgi:hypothetical protein
MLQLCINPLPFAVFSKNIKLGRFQYEQMIGLAGNLTLVPAVLTT